MDLNDILLLLEEIRSGRPEDRALELKGKWWDLSNATSKLEFLKDIAAMANSNTRDDKKIIIGIDGSGAVTNAPLPEDEADLQQKLRAISPVPTVRFTPIFMPDHDATISVIELQEPF